MNRLKCVLVGVDFSPNSVTALAQAARMAKWNGAKLHVLHVVDALVVSDVAGAISRSPDELAREVDRHSRALLESTVRKAEIPSEVAFHVAVGVPIQEFVRKVRELSADLLVLGVRGASETGHGTGRLAHRCVRKAPTKVLLVREGRRSAFRTVVACVDFSDNARRAVEQAVRVAVQDRSELHLLHVYEGPWRRLKYSGFRIASDTESPKFQAQYVEALRAELECAFAPHRADCEGLDVHLDLVEASDYSRGILAHTQEIGADLVVLGTRGRANLQYVLLGSTAERVVAETHCSVLAIKPADFTVSAD